LRLVPTGNWRGTGFSIKSASLADPSSPAILTLSTWGESSWTSLTRRFTERLRTKWFRLLLLRSIINASMWLIPCWNHWSIYLTSEWDANWRVIFELLASLCLVICHEVYSFGWCRMLFKILAYINRTRYSELHLCFVFFGHFLLFSFLFVFFFSW